MKVKDLIEKLSKLPGDLIVMNEDREEPISAVEMAPTGDNYAPITDMCVYIQ